MDEKNNNKINEFCFGDCRLVVPRREIWRAGELIGAEPRVFNLLLYLVQHRDRAVDKNELQDEIWRGMIVTEAALTRCVMKARRAIGDEGSDAELIKTIRGHGYRFVADVDVVAEKPNAGPTEPLRDKPSVAVLPFANTGGDDSDRYFSDGITEDIITELSRFRSLFVIARQSSFSFRDSDKTGAEIAAELGVEFVVDGSVQRSGDRLRINVRLFNAGDERQVWSERYDREMQDVLLIQEEVAATVAATIGGRVEATRGRRRIDANAIESYDCLLRAQALYYKIDPVANAEARVLLERALELDPDNSRALALLAAVHSMDNWSFWVEDVDRSRELSLDFGRRSLELDDGDSLAQALFAEILADCEYAQQSEQHFRRAIELNPNDIAARALYASRLGVLGRGEEAIEHMTVAERLDPFSLLWIPWLKGKLMFTLGRYEDAVDALQSMPQPPNEAILILAAALAKLEQYEDAAGARESFLERARREMPGYPGEALADWAPMFDRMLGFDRETDLPRLLEALQLGGWE